MFTASFQQVVFVGSSNNVASKSFERIQFLFSRKEGMFKSSAIKIKI